MKMHRVMFCINALFIKLLLVIYFFVVCMLTFTCHQPLVLCISISNSHTGLSAVYSIRLGVGVHSA